MMNVSERGTIIYGFCGAMAAGKSTAAKIMQQKLTEGGFSAKVYAFADPIKIVAREHFNWDGQKDERGRRLLQVLGTEGGRAYDPFIWVHKTFQTIYAENPQYALIDDVRFPNEAKAIKDAGGILFYIQRTVAEQPSTLTARHESEQHYRGLEGIMVENNGSIDDLTFNLAKALIEPSLFDLG